jgi:hypothetical protein
MKPMQPPDFVISLNSDYASESPLKAQLLEGLRTLTTDAATLRHTVNHLFNCGISRKTMEEWGGEAGYSLAYMRSLISKLLTSKGIRKRKPGAGRRPSCDVLAVVALISERYGPERAARLLRAAWREAKARAEARSDRTQSLIVVPQLDHQTRSASIPAQESKNPEIHQPTYPPLAPSLVAEAAAFATLNPQAATA